MTDEQCKSEANINYYVEEWCESDGNGANYGYTWEWEIVTDEAIIKQVYGEKITEADNKIKNLQDERCELISHYVQFINSTTK